MNVQSHYPLSQFAETHRPDPSLPAFTKRLAWITFSLFMLIIPLFACSIYGFTVSENAGIPILILAALCAIAFIVAFSAGKKQQKSQQQKERAEATKRWLDQNDLDFHTSQTLRERLDLLLNSPFPPSLVNPSIFQVSVFQRLVVGEVSNHFDQQTQTLISVWLEQTGLVGLRVGREALLGDSFIAMLDQQLPNGIITDTVRVVVPSEFLIRAFLGDFANAIDRQFSEGSHCHEAIQFFLLKLRSFSLIDVSKVLDRLKAILRMPSEEKQRHTVSIIGAMFPGYRILLVEAILFENEQQAFNLFPISFCMEVKEIANEAAETLQSRPLVDHLVIT